MDRKSFFWSQDNKNFHPVSNTGILHILQLEKKIHEQPQTTTYAKRVFSEMFEYHFNGVKWQQDILCTLKPKLLIFFCLWTTPTQFQDLENESEFANQLNDYFDEQHLEGFQLGRLPPWVKNHAENTARKFPRNDGIESLLKDIPSRRRRPKKNTPPPEDKSIESDAVESDRSVDRGPRLSFICHDF